MTTAEAKPVGTLMPIEPGTTVTWPDQTARVISGPGVVLDTPGTWTINGSEVEVQ